MLLHETIWVERTKADCFDYVSNFSTTQDWDPGVVKAAKLTDGPVRVGTEFEVACALPLGSIDLEYVITDLKPNKSITLVGQCAFFTVTDTISFKSSKKGCQIDYKAKFKFARGLASVARFGGSAMDKMGKKALAGLEQALSPVFATANAEAATTSNISQIANFTRRGFSKGQADFKPISTNMAEKHVVITGTTTGIGYASAEMLAKRGANLTLVMRDEQRAVQTVERLKLSSGNSNITFLLADLSSIEETKNLATTLLASGRPIDVLVNNAGALFDEWQATSEGIERSAALLLISPYVLTTALKPLLAAAGNARVVNVVSGGMYTQKLSMKTLVAKQEDPFSGSVAYARAKRALMVATEELAQAWEAEGIAVNAMHPGWADTPGVASSLPTFRRITKPVLRDSAQGADTIFWLAAGVDAVQHNGKLFLDRISQPTHLFRFTREHAEERSSLMTFLRSYEISQPVTNASKQR